MKRLARIGITTGCQKGISPEIIEKVTQDKELRKLYELKVLAVEDDYSGVKSLGKSVDELSAGQIDAVVTAPICKEEVAEAGFQHIGHTEFFAQNFRVADQEPLMIMVSGGLRVALATKHIPVSEIPQNISVNKILSILRSLNKTLKSDFAVDSPKIAVLALNPHSGEGGLLGSEEINIITPAIEAACNEKIQAFGPYAADGFFGSGAYEKFDAVLAMYHDQGLAPFKTLAFDGGVNVTSGLSVVRTSPAHGIGLDIAGSGVADSGSMRAAIYMAVDIARNRIRYRQFSANPLQPQAQSHSGGGNRRGGAPMRDANVEELLANQPEGR